MINTQAEAKEWLVKAMSATMKARSTVCENMNCTPDTMPDVMKMVLKQSQPGLFSYNGSLDVLSVLGRYDQKKVVLTRSDMMNCMMYVMRCPVVAMTMDIMHVFTCIPMDIMTESTLPLMEDSQ